ncbi:DUF3450 domain-containing protein [Pseudomonas lurida]|uniref:hypothetical protein n=1 Tax=Pseudomonas lurida TaxID=244566 RepID=UPI0015E38E6C|nr:hypothetical protein [Pseudomonas lurida]MBA1293439.1 DUF3450 domain-containing protein [Pseudomonas lurida]
MLDDLTTAIKAQLYERATSPLLGSFLISWCIINYKVLLIVFSSLSGPEKITYINMNLFANKNDYLTMGFLFPLATSLALILIYPYPAAWIYKISRSHHKELKKIKQAIEDETPLTQKEGRELRTIAIRQQAAADVAIQKHLEEIKTLKTIISQLEPNNVQLADQIHTKEKERVDIQRKLDAALKDIETLEELVSNPNTGTSIDFNNLEPFELIERQGNQRKTSAPLGNMGREYIFKTAIEAIEKYIQDIKPFGNINCSVYIANEKVYTSYPTTNGELVQAWGSLDVEAISTSTLTIMNNLRNHREKS